MAKGEKAALERRIESLKIDKADLLERLGRAEARDPRVDREAWESMGYRRGWDAAMRDQGAKTSPPVDLDCGPCQRCGADATDRTYGGCEHCREDDAPDRVGPLDDDEDRVLGGEISLGDRIVVTLPRVAGDLAPTSRYFIVEALGLRNESGPGGSWEGLELFLRLDPTRAQGSTLDDAVKYARQATGQQKRADRLKRALADLHRTHARLKRGRRKVEQRLTTRTRERDAALRAKIKAERACESLQHALNSLADDLLQERATRDCLVHDAERALDSEIQLKHAAVRALRKAIAGALEIISTRTIREAALADAETLVEAHLGTIESLLLRALRDVYDPDDGGVH